MTKLKIPVQHGNIVWRKPPEYNTIDFLISIKKDKLNELDLKSKIINGE